MWPPFGAPMKVRLQHQRSIHQEFLTIAQSIDDCHTVEASSLTSYCLYEGIEHGLLLGAHHDAERLLSQLDVSTWRIEHLTTDATIELFRVFDWSRIEASWLEQLDGTHQWHHCKSITTCSLNLGQFESAYQLTDLYLQQNDVDTREALSIRKLQSETLYRLGETDEAYERLMELKNTIPPEIDLDFKIAVWNSLAISAENPDIGIPLLTEVSAMLEEADRPLKERLENQAEIANQYHHAGDVDTALSLFESVLEQMDDDEELLSSFRSHRYNLGQLYMTLERETEGWPVLLEVLEECRNILGPTHPRTLFVISELATLHLECEEPESALDLLSKGWRTAKHRLHFGHPDTLSLGLFWVNTHLEEHESDTPPQEWYRAYEQWLNTESSEHSTLSDGRHRVWSVDETDPFGKAQHLVEIALGNDAHSAAEWLIEHHLSQAIETDNPPEIRWWVSNLVDLWSSAPSPDHLEQLENWITNTPEPTRLTFQEGKAKLLDRLEDESALPFMLSSLSSIPANNLDIHPHTLESLCHILAMATTQIWNDDWFEEAGYDEQIAPIITNTRTLLSPHIEGSDDEVLRWWHRTHLNLAQIHNEPDESAVVASHFAIVFNTLEQSDWADDDTRISSHYKMACFQQELENWTEAQAHFKTVLQLEEHRHGLDSYDCLSTIADLLDVSAEIEDDETMSFLLSLVHAHIEVLDADDEDDAELLERLKEWITT